jgi:hypothetical protein
VAIANILGAGICFMFSDQFAKLALLRYSIIMPLILCVVFVGAFQGSRQWGDIYTLLTFGTVGWIMKRLGWPRPPVILGVVLGDIVERYMFISVERYGTEWIFPTSLANARWVVLAMFALSIYGLLRPLIKEFKMVGGAGGMLRAMQPSKPQFDIQTLFYVAFIGLLGYMMYEASTWNHDARIIPNIVGYFGLGILVLSLVNYTFKSLELGADPDDPAVKVKRSLHLDLAVRGADMPKKLIALRAIGYLGWLLAYLLSSALIGMIPSLFLFVIAYMKIEGNESWKLTLACAFGITIFSIVLFDKLLSLPWPQAELVDLYIVWDENVQQPIGNWIDSLFAGPGG